MSWLELREKFFKVCFLCFKDGQYHRAAANSSKKTSWKLSNNIEESVTCSHCLSVCSELGQLSHLWMKLYCTACFQFIDQCTFFFIQKDLQNNTKPIRAVENWDFNLFILNWLLECSLKYFKGGIYCNYYYSRKIPPV